MGNEGKHNHDFYVSSCFKDRLPTRKHVRSFSSTLNGVSKIKID